MEPALVDLLTEALQSAAAAHGRYEQELGRPDPDWPQWYARHMTRALGEAGYQLSRSGQR
ncbi:MAG TPA: hypothetical protein VGG25_10765 [Streptosporangiaceae bacterium]|jgi:hypothetical protein